MITLSDLFFVRLLELLHEKYFHENPARGRSIQLVDPVLNSGIPLNSLQIFTY